MNHQVVSDKAFSNYFPHVNPIFPYGLCQKRQNLAHHSTSRIFEINHSTLSDLHLLTFILADHLTYVLTCHFYLVQQSVINFINHLKFPGLPKHVAHLTMYQSEKRKLCYCVAASFESSGFSNRHGVIRSSQGGSLGPCDPGLEGAAGSSSFSWGDFTETCCGLSRWDVEPEFNDV